MSRHFSILVLLNLTMALTFLGGCGKPTPESLAKDVVGKMNDLTGILKGVTDEASAKIAAPKLKAVGEEMQKIQEQAYGGLNPSAQRELNQIIKLHSNKSGSKAELPRRIQPGAQNVAVPVGDHRLAHHCDPASIGEERTDVAQSPGPDHNVVGRIERNRDPAHRVVPELREIRANSASTASATTPISPISVDTVASAAAAYAA